jgi:hypothetical protein
VQIRAWYRSRGAERDEAKSLYAPNVVQSAHNTRARLAGEEEEECLFDRIAWMRSKEDLE